FFGQPLSSTFAILSLLTEGENSKSMYLLGFGNYMSKRKYRRNYWKQKELEKMAKVELRVLLFWD
ncbi:MAG: hypothetical protein NZ602_17220, partial [Thermoguttaceae bacterium]|nr:hypothetical protein [Thermoguttaceae bacterium]MDW8039763.1 hypothetical protein [Thermoguttaceae bacterium]